MPFPEGDELEALAKAGRAAQERDAVPTADDQGSMEAPLMPPDEEEEDDTEVESADATTPEPPREVPYQRTPAERRDHRRGIEAFLAKPAKADLHAGYGADEADERAVAEFRDESLPLPPDDFDPLAYHPEPSIEAPPPPASRVNFSPEEQITPPPVAAPPLTKAASSGPSFIGLPNEAKLLPEAGDVAAETAGLGAAEGAAAGAATAPVGIAAGIALGTLAPELIKSLPSTPQSSISQYQIGGGGGVGGAADGGNSLAVITSAIIAALNKSAGTKSRM